MPIIRRDDGIQFAIQTYRERLRAKSLSLLRNEIRLISQSQGEFVRVFKTNRAAIEAVFSRDPGFLLGEAVWYYFGRPSDLIYCEALPGTRQALVVVVKSSTVYLDAKIPFMGIADEFATLFAGSNRYDVYVYGDVPISDQPEGDKFVFQSELISSFHRLEESLFNKLIADEVLELQPLELALRSEVFRRSSYWRVGTLSVIILVLLIYGYQQWIVKEEVMPTTAVAPVTTVSPVDQALMTPPPERLLAEFTDSLGLIMTAPGWTPSNVTYQDNSYVYRLTELGGTLTALRAWAQDQGLALQLTEQGIDIRLPSSLEKRTEPQSVSNSQAVVVQIIDTVNRLLASKSVRLGETKILGNIKETSLTINLSQVSPSVVNLLGKSIHGMPVRLDAMRLSIAQGLLSGTIAITVVGN